MDKKETDEKKKHFLYNLQQKQPKTTTTTNPPPYSLTTNENKMKNSHSDSNVKSYTNTFEFRIGQKLRPRCK